MYEIRQALRAATGQLNLAKRRDLVFYSAVNRLPVETGEVETRVGVILRLVSPCFLKEIFFQQRHEVLLF